MSCNLCYHGAFWTRGRERLPSARMFADGLASVHMHEFKPSLVTKLPRTATKNKFACPIRAAAHLCEGGFGPPKIGSHRRDRRPPAPPLVAAGERDSGTPQVGGCPRTFTCTLKQQGYPEDMWLATLGGRQGRR